MIGNKRAIVMLQRAATLEPTQQSHLLNARVINESGHKLPSGYPEGRRMWVNVQFFDAFDALIGEHGYYDAVNADLTEHDTKVYEINLGVDEAVSAATGVPVGVSFHFALNNVIYKDNRIPPRGFTNAAFQTIQASPVGQFYADGQYWDDTGYEIPTDAATATLRLYYQTTSREYVEFLRDENVTDDRGDVLYAQWELTGKSPPVMMATSVIEFDPFPTGDSTGDGEVTLADFTDFQECFTGPDAGPIGPGCDVFDFDLDDDVDLADAAVLQVRFERF